MPDSWHSTGCRISGLGSVFCHRSYPMAALGKLLYQLALRSTLDMIFQNPMIKAR